MASALDRMSYVMFADSPEQRARLMVQRFSAALHVRTPDVLVVKAAAGPCYEALFNRIKIDERTLALPESLLSMVLAHEVGHATQRARMLLDFFWTGLGTAALLSVPCIVFATSSGDDIWRVSAPAIGFALALLVCRNALRPRVRKRITALEIDADAKAAQLCGAASALQALEAMSQRVYIEPARLDAMRARLARASE
jgi:Zn-dependent protease with chaperone function